MLAAGCAAEEQPDDGGNQTSAGTRGCDGEVNVPDPALAAVLRAQLGLDDDAAIEGASLAEILNVSAPSSGITNLQGLECAHALQMVTLYGNDVTDASPLAELEALQQVYLGENAISDVSPFAGIPNLGVLQLASNEVTDVSALRGHARLQTLGLDGNAITSTADIADLPALNNLDLTNNPIAELEGLTGLPNVFALRLGGTMVADLGAIAGMSRLDNLHVEHAALASLDSLPDLPALTWIDASYNALHEVEILGGPGFPSLDQVTLDGNPLDGVESVAAIAGAHTISINDVGVADLAPFVVDSSLRRLSARSNGITDLAPVAWVDNLDLADNSIVDVAPLAGTAHGSLDLSDNQIVDGTPLLQVDFDHCGTVSIDGNPLADGEALTEDLCGVPLVVTDVCLPAACDPCDGAEDCG